MLKVSRLRLRPSSGHQRAPPAEVAPPDPPHGPPHPPDSCSTPGWDGTWTRRLTLSPSQTHHQPIRSPSPWHRGCFCKPGQSNQQGRRLRRPAPTINVHHMASTKTLLPSPSPLSGGRRGRDRGSCQLQALEDQIGPDLWAADRPRRSAAVLGTGPALSLELQWAEL